MSVDFGTVIQYLEERGFGFVSHSFLAGHQSEVFFHIRTVRKANPRLAEQLGEGYGVDDLYFWYDTEVTDKGEQVQVVLNSEDIRGGVIGDLSSYITEIEVMWRDVGRAKPTWLDEVTVDLVGLDRANQLSTERKSLEEERRQADARAREAREAQRAIEEAKRQKQIEADKAKQDLEEAEFQDLLAEMKPLRFTRSREVSDYIVKNSLGHKYKNISGVLQMELDGNTWAFNGGFPTEIFARLCKELGLRNQGTRARPIAFKSFKDLEESRFRNG